MKDYRELKVWQKSHVLTMRVYEITSTFPKHEVFGLVTQLRRCSISIPSNLAEGCGRGSDADFKRFVQIATGSALELDYQLFLAYELKYIEHQTYDAISKMLSEVRKMLGGLLKSL
jgi:four helix bundle protein